MTADQIFTELRAQGLPVKGLVIRDPADPATWAFDGLDAAQRAQAVTIVSTLDQTLADRDAQTETTRKIIRAVTQALWEAIPLPTLTRLQLRDRILAIYKTL
jgi:hypothetical protein